MTKGSSPATKLAIFTGVAFVNQTLETTDRYCIHHLLIIVKQSWVQVRLSFMIS